MNYIYSSMEKFDCNISINSLLKSVNSNKKIYSYIPNIEKYIDDWKYALYNSYISEKNETCFIGKERVFYQSLFINGSEMRVHFNVNSAIKLSMLLQSEKLPIYLFAENNKQNLNAIIKYTCPSVLDNIRGYSICQKPVILVNFFHCGLQYLVIDGNHRIAARKIENISEINGILLPPQYVERILYSRFETAVYLFLYEGFLLEKGILEVLEKSNSKRFFNI